MPGYSRQVTHFSTNETSGVYVFYTTGPDFFTAMDDFTETLCTVTLPDDQEVLNYTEAVMRLSMQQTILQATQQSYASTSEMSLFHYM